MTLHLDYRPNSFDSIFGNEAIVSALKGMFNSPKDIPHAFLFTGLPGCGKTTLGFVLKEELEVSTMDFHVYDTANIGGVDTIRYINSDLKNAPMDGKRKLYLLDEAHRISPEGLNALLRTLEYGCPKHCYFVLCTAEFDSIRATLRSALKRRCSTFELKPLNIREMGELLEGVLKAEGFDEYPEAITKKLISMSEGSPGHALGMLDSIINVTDEDEALEIINYAAYGSKEVFDICKILANNQITDKWSRVKKIIPSIKKNDVESLRHGMLNWFEKALLDKSSPAIADIMTLLTETFMYTGRPGMSLALWFICLKMDDSDIPF